MADDLSNFIFYEEDYDEELSDWDEAPDQDNDDNNITKPMTPPPVSTNKPIHSSPKPDHTEEKNGISKIPRHITQSPTALAQPYIPKSISSTFIVHKYAVFTSEEILCHINNMIDEIASTLNIDSCVVSLLLRIYEWKAERLMENYLLDSVSCIRSHNLHLISCAVVNINNNDMCIECAMCLCDVLISDTFSLSCNHRFCNECWRCYIVNAMNNLSFNCILLFCPSHKCITPLSSSVIDRFCHNCLPKYWSYIVSSFVSFGNNLYRFCPSPNCKYIIYCGSATDSCDCSVLVQCRCGYDVCFLCLEEYHAPANCDEIERWNLKCLSESDNAQWIVTNTKKCPKCFTRIERNHWCNHMVCTKCQHEFCWVCIGSWKQHGIGTGGYYRCNKYKPKASMGNKHKLQEKEDEELDKFVHYFNRFHNHAQSRQFLIQSSHKILRKIKNHLNTKSNNNKSWIDVEFLQNAHDEIFFCRQILKYTYVYAYYLRNGAEKDLFEFLQQDLEKNCEILHELCEQNWKNINPTHIINYTNITHRFVKQLLHGIAKGLTK